ncbi:hypothetical protein SAMN05877838_3790 [Hoeflea halophila]|uniref:Head-tail joining protein n=1 Tax=Hoeflea halophila TaxID=714899 RepID=A0A286IGR8_9HYPH|nr:hypothetical protein [Hoeflea halophila]SOE18846.1 hypothetical protein SAMN05877838_3790 [Hoeflea halophila]
MASLFDRAEARASVALDRVFAELVTLQALISGANSRPRPDTSRRDQTVYCVFIEQQDREAGEDARPGDKKLDAIGAAHWLSIDLRSLTLPIKRGDQLFRHKTGHRYRVKAINPDGEGRLKFYLQLLSGEAL